jgi:hypothetical protein
MTIKSATELQIWVQARCLLEAGDTPRQHRKVLKAQYASFN